MLLFDINELLLKQVVENLLSNSWLLSIFAFIVKINFSPSKVKLSLPFIVKSFPNPVNKLFSLFPVPIDNV